MIRNVTLFVQMRMRDKLPFVHPRYNKRMRTKNTLHLCCAEYDSRLFSIFLILQKAEIYRMLHFDPQGA